ncbi:hypothetical protein D3C71_1614460 [compost metagenome]
MSRRDQQRAHDRADNELAEQLLARRQAERTLEDDFDVIVQKADQAVTERRHQQHVKVRVDDGKFQVGQRKRHDDDNAAHRRGPCFFQMALRPVIADLLAEFHPAQQRDQQRSGDHRKDKGYGYGQ